MSEPCGGIVRRNGLECIGDGQIQGFLGPGFGGTDEFFELGPGVFDGIQVGRIGRQVKQLCMAGFDPFAYPVRLMRRQVIHHHHVVGPQPVLVRWQVTLDPI